jgi:hypothetical protein
LPGCGVYGDSRAEASADALGQNVKSAFDAAIKKAQKLCEDTVAKFSCKHG